MWQQQRSTAVWLDRTLILQLHKHSFSFRSPLSSPPLSPPPPPHYCWSWTTHFTPLAVSESALSHSLWCLLTYYCGLFMWENTVELFSWHNCCLSWPDSGKKPPQVKIPAGVTSYPGKCQRSWEGEKKWTKCLENNPFSTVNTFVCILDFLDFFFLCSHLMQKNKTKQSTRTANIKTWAGCLQAMKFRQHLYDAFIKCFFYWCRSCIIKMWHKMFWQMLSAEGPANNSICTATHKYLILVQQDARMIY